VHGSTAGNYRYAITCSVKSSTETNKAPGRFSRSLFSELPHTWVVKDAPTPLRSDLQLKLGGVIFSPLLLIKQRRLRKQDLGDGDIPCISFLGDPKEKT